MQSSTKISAFALAVFLMLAPVAPSVEAAEATGVAESLYEWVENCTDRLLEIWNGWSDSESEDPPIPQAGPAPDPAG